MLAIALVVNLAGGWVAQSVIRRHWEGSLPKAKGMMAIDLLPDEEVSAEPRDKEKLVESRSLSEEKRPKKTKRISEFDNRVEKETKVERGHKERALRSVQKGDAPDADGAIRSTEVSQTTDEDDSRGRETTAREDSKSADTASEEDLRQADDGSWRAHPRASEAKQRQGIAGSPDMLRETFGKPGSIDHLKEVDEGDAQVLNTRRSLFASFFNRVRDGVAQHWHPEVVHAARDPEGRMFGNKTRVTKLLIRLTKDGDVKRVLIENPSGIGYLDEEAIRSVRLASPFTNPPPGLVDDGSGYIDFGFRFIFELNGGRKIYRYTP